MEIITKRTHCPTEIVPRSTSESDVIQEVNSRTYKAGLTDRDGQRMIRLAEIVSKPATDKYRENYVKIFKHD